MKLEWLSRLSDAELVAELRAPHRARGAYWELAARGRRASGAIVAGLADEDAGARLHCCRLLDRIYQPSDFSALLAMLDDPHAAVRSSALHTLTCDRCKDADLPAADGPLLDRAIAILAADPDAHVRAMALEAVGRAVHDQAAARLALMAAIERDPSPAVRKKARWYAPGGPLHRRSSASLAR